VLEDDGLFWATMVMSEQEERERVYGPVVCAMYGVAGLIPVKA